MHLHLIDDITWNSPATLFFLFFLQHCKRTRRALARFPVSAILPSPPSTSSGLTFRRFALSSVMFIVYGVDDEVADDEVYSDAPRSSGPAGRPSQSECLISYFWFSYFVAVPYLLLLFLIFCPRTDSPHPPATIPRSPTFSTIELDLHRAISRASSQAYVGSVLVADSRYILDEINEIRYRDRARFVATEAEISR